MSSEETATIEIQNGELHVFNLVKDFMGNPVSYYTEALTQNGDRRIVSSNYGEMNFQEKSEAGIMGQLERAVQIDSKSLREKYDKLDRTQNPEEALRLDKEFYLMRKNNIEEMMAKQNGVVWNEKNGSLKRIDGKTACEMLNENVRRAVENKVFGEPNAQGFYYDPLNKALPPGPLPSYSVNNMTGMMQHGGRNAIMGNHGKDLSVQNKFAGSKAKKNYGRLFPTAGGMAKYNEPLDTDMSVRSSIVNENTSLGPAHIADFLENQIKILGANPNVNPDDPFYLSYANRREKYVKNNDIMPEERCDMNVQELLNYYMNLKLKDANVKVAKLNHNSLKGYVMDLENVDTKKIHFAKQITPSNWHSMEIEMLRRLISTGRFIQPFEGFATSPEGGNILATFERKNFGIEQYLQRQPLTDDLFKRLFTVMLNALCHLESIGLHHPNMSTESIVFTELDVNAMKIENPFLYDSIYEEIANVYLNRVNTIPGQAAFNKRYLQENVMEMFLVLMSLKLNTSFENYSPNIGKFDGNEIRKGLASVRVTCSPYVNDLLSRYLNTPLQLLPTPLQLANNEGLSIDHNSYYGHSKLNTNLYYPFEQFSGMKGSNVTPLKATPPPFSGRIPHYSEIDYYTSFGDNLNESRYRGIEHRKNNFVVQEGSPQNPVLKPYVVKLKDADSNTNMSNLIANDSPPGIRNQGFQNGILQAYKAQEASFNGPQQHNWDDSPINPSKSLPFGVSPQLGHENFKPTDTFSPITTPMAGFSPFLGNNQPQTGRQIQPIPTSSMPGQNPLNISGNPH